MATITENRFVPFSSFASENGLDEVEQREYEVYWETRWKNHPLNRSLTPKEAGIVMVEPAKRFFDMQRFVLIKDLVYKWAQRGKMVSAKPPKFIKKHRVGKNRVEVPLPYQTFYTGKFEGVSPDMLYFQNLSMFNYDERTHYKFTIGNFEAALKITKPIWKYRTDKKKAWEYVIVPICYEFLSELQRELNGYNEEFFQELREDCMRFGVNTVLDQMESYAEEVNENFLMEQVEELNVEVVPEPKYADCLDVGEIQTQIESNVPFIATQLKDNQVPKFASKYQRRWYPIVRIPKKNPKVPSHPKKKREVVNNWYDSLSAAYMLIGRPDIVARMHGPIRMNWIRTKVIDRIYFDFSGKLMPWEEHPLKRRYEAQGKCESFKYREKMYRILDQYLILMKRHRDKMEILCHRGRFAYMTNWDIGMFQRQKRAILTMDEHLLKEWQESLPIEIVDMPMSYVEQAAYVIKALEVASVCRTTRTLAIAVRTLVKLVEDWAVNDFSILRTACLEAQADDKPTGNLKSGAPAANTGTGAKADVAATNKPITTGEKKVTLTSVDQREVAVAKTVAQKPKIHKDSSAEIMYTLDEICRRPMLIDRVTWKVGDEMGKELGQYMIPDIYFSAEEKKATTVCQNLTATYIISMFGAMYYKSIEAELRTNTQQFQSGQLIMYFKPMYMKSRSVDIFHNATQFPHIIVDACVSNSGKLSMPWINPRDRFPIYSDPHGEVNYCGTLHIAVWNPLQVGATGSTDASLTLWMSIQGINCTQLVNPKPPGSVHFASDIWGKDIVGLGERRKIARPYIKVEKVTEWEAQALDFDPTALVENLVEKGTDLIKVAGAELVENTMQSALGSLPFLSKPHVCKPPKPVTILTTQNPSWGFGADLAQRLSLNPMAIAPPDDDMTSPGDLKDLIRSWSRIRVAVVNDTDGANATIIKLPVTPMLNSVTSATNHTTEMSYIDATTSTSASNPGCTDSKYDIKNTVKCRYGSMLDYLARGFLFFKGGLEMKLEAVASLHSCRILIRYEPYGTGNSASAECQKMTSPGIIWDVRENKSIIVTLPQNSTQPLLTTEYMSEGAVTNTQVTQTAYGLIELSIVNPLKVTPGIAKNMPINIYMRGAEDFEFFGMRLLNQLVATRDSYLLTNPIGKPMGNVNLSYALYQMMGATLAAQKASAVTETDVGGRKYIYVNNGRLAQYTSQKGRYGFDGFLDNIKDMVTAFQKAKKDFPFSVNVPEFVDLDASLAWVHTNFGTESTYVQTQAKMYQAVWGETMSYAVMQKLLWWTAVALLKEHAWILGISPKQVITNVGRVQPIFIWDKDTKARPRQWEAQAKTSQEADRMISGINPFNKYQMSVPPVKKLLGDDYSSIYPMMKRYHSAFKMLQLPNYADGDKDEPDARAKAYKEQLVRDIFQIPYGDRKDFYFELVIPITPYVAPDRIGGPYNYIADVNNLGSCRPFYAPDVLKASSMGNLGCSRNLTSSRFFGELFTAWRGDQNYGIIIEEPVDAFGNPFKYYVSINPRMFPSWSAALGSFSLVHSRRVMEHTRLGQQLVHANLTPSLFIQAPYVSKYSRLLLSDEINEMTCTGAIIIHVPLRTNKYGYCTNREDIPFDISKCAISSPKFQILHAIGDNCRYFIPRAAPKQIVWPRAYDITPDFKFQDLGYDDAETPSALKSKETEIMPLGSAHIELTNAGVLSDKWSNPLIGVSDMIKLAKKEAGPWKVDDYLKVKSATWAKGFPPVPKKVVTEKEVPEVEETDTYWEAQADDGVDVVSDAIQERDVTVASSEDELDGLLRNLHVGVSDFNALLSSATVAVSTVKNAAESVQLGMNKISSTTTEVVGTVGKVATYTLNATRVMCFFKGIKDFLEAKEWSERWIPMATCALALGLSSDVVVKAGEYLMSAASTIFGSTKVHENRSAQAYEDTWDQSWTAFVEDHASALRFVAAGIVTLVTFYMTSKAPSASRVAGFSGNMITKLRNFAIVGSALKTLDWMWKWISQVIKEALTTVCDWASGGTLSAHRMISHYPEVVRWIRSVEIYNLEQGMTTLYCDNDARIKLLLRMDEGEKLLAKVASKTGNLYNTLQRGMITLQKAHDRTISARHATPFRIDPYHICLFGAAGVGKSALTKFIMDVVMTHCKIPQKHRWYVRSEEEDHWNNYRREFCTMIDDLYSDRKGKALKELIRMKTNMPWAVPRAEIEEKGMPFTSLFIGTNTNVAFPKPDDTVTPAAIWRRRNILVQVRRIRPIQVGGINNWKDVRFDILNPENANGEIEIWNADLTLDDFLMVACKSAEYYLEGQKALVFSSLQGNVVPWPVLEVGDDRQEVENIYECVKSMLDQGMHLTQAFMRDIVNKTTAEEFMSLYETEGFKREIARHPDMATPVAMKRETALLERYMNELKNGGHPTDVHIFVERMVEYNLMIKEGNTYTPQIAGALRADLGKIILTTTDTGVNVEWIAQAEDVFEGFEVGDPPETLDQTREHIREALQANENLLDGYQHIIARLCRHRATRTKKLADETEIANYVAHCFPEASQKEKALLVKDFVQTFNWAQGQDRFKLETDLQKESQFGKLFTSELDSKWKKVDQDWVMIFSEEDYLDDELMEASTLYNLMVEAWDATKINNMKEACKVPITLKNDGWIKGLVTYYENKRKIVQKWAEDHPHIVKILKIGAGVAALFASYKLLNYLCPAVFDKIKAILWGIFGWTVGKIGEERVEKITTTGKATVAAIKYKSKEYLDWVKALMRSSGDAELIEKVDDEEAVQLVAEGLSKQVKTVKNVLAMQEAAKSPEGKTRIMNAYMLGQDRKAEANVQPAQQSNKDPKWLAQGSNDQAATDIRNNLLSKNMCRVMWASEEHCVSMSGLMIGGRNLLVPSHFFEQAKVGQHFVMTFGSGIEFWQAYDPNEAVIVYGKDAMVYRCSVRVGMFKNIVKHFIPEKELTFKATPATLNILNSTLMMAVMMTNASLVYEISYQFGGEKFRNTIAWEYEATTAKGDCGGILLADSNAVRSKILGMHVCGAPKNNIGSATLLTQEELEEAIKLLPAEQIKPIEFVPQALISKPVTSMKIQPVGNFELLGAVAPSKAVKLPHKTEIEPSAIHDLVREHVSEPAVLTASDPRNESGRSPLGQALAKYGVPTLPFNPVKLKYVRDDILTEVKRWKAPMGKRKLTDHEAVFGNEMIDYCDRMNLNASPGYPYTLSRPSGEKGKAYLYDVNSADGIADPEYRYTYQAREKLAKEGIRKVSVWTDCLKDERRKLEKIRKGKTRAFMLPPADFVQLCRKYFMSFCVAFYSARINSFSAVGIDPYSFDWTRLIRRLRRKSNWGFGGDFHSFDGIFDPEILDSVAYIINQWYQDNPDEDYEDQDNVVRKVLVEEMIHTVHICLDSMYRKFQGNPSGNPLTVIINTFAHCFYLRLAWMALAERFDSSMAGMHQFHQNVEEIYYGDDGLLTVKWDVAKWFNLESVSSFLAEHKIEYTSESKDEELYGVRRVVECSFLKNRFVKMKDSTLWLAPIDKDTIYELTNWVRKSDDPLAQLRENLENAINFAFHHGKEFFENFCFAVNQALRLKGLREIAYSYALMKSNFETKCRA